MIDYADFGRFALGFVLVSGTLLGIVVVVESIGAEVNGIVGGGNDTEANKACAETFGENYEYAGYMAGNPPVMHCDGPGGKAYMDMPESVAENMNINATAYHD